MDKLGIPMAESGRASNLQEALTIAERIGYPLMVRPSYVLGGRGMEIVYDEEMLKEYVAIHQWGHPLKGLSRKKTYVLAKTQSSQRVLF